MNNFFGQSYDSLTDQQKMAWDNRIIWITVGSNLYGTNTPTSDEDYMGIFMPDEEYVIGMKRVNEVDLSIKSKKEDGKNDEDAVDNKYYEYRQYLMKAVDNNPNILELLFVNKENIKFINDFGMELLDNAHLFPHKGLKKKFLGYAFSQKHKMVIRTEHYHTIKEANEYFQAFLDDDLQHETLRERRKMLTALFVERYSPSFLVEKKGHFELGDLKFQKHVPVGKMAKAVAERFAKASHRKGLMEKYGYDTKFGSHLVRLMLEGKALLETGKLTFPLKEANLLLAIKQGKYEMKEILQMAEQFEAEIESGVDNSELPAKPRYNEVQAFCMRQLKEHFGYV